MQRSAALTAASRLALAVAAVTLLAVPAPAVAASPLESGNVQGVADATRLSSEASRTLAWIVRTGDNLDLPFLLIDKVEAHVFAFDSTGNLQDSSAALLGLGRGDVSAEGIGRRRLADISPGERTTPAGRFVASLGNDLGEADVLWVDYDNAISLHRVITGSAKDRRLQRLKSRTALDNRISYGCINVPVEFFERTVLKLFNRTNGIVYILPENSSASDLFMRPAPAASRPDPAGLLSSR